MAAVKIKNSTVRIDSPNRIIRSKEYSEFLREEFSVVAARFCWVACWNEKFSSKIKEFLIEI